MPASRTRPRRAGAGAAAIVHPQFLRDRLAGRLDDAPAAAATVDGAVFDRLRNQAASAHPSVGAAHPGRKGQAAHRVKTALRRSLYWYVEPSIDALRATNLALIYLNEALAGEVARLRNEVAALRIDHESDLASRERTSQRSGAAR